MSSYKVTPTDDGALLLGAADKVRSVLQSVSIILSTPRGSVPMYRDFGINMEYLDLPMPIAEVRMVSEIREAVQQWEPRATVTGVSFRRDTLNGKLIPIVEVEIDSEQE